MPAGLHTFICEQGATFSRTVTVTDSAGAAVSLSGYSARMKVRRTHSSSDVLVSLTSSSGLTLGGAAGTIAILISATATAALSPVRAVYDLEIESGAGVVTRILEGDFVITAEVSR